MWIVEIQMPKEVAFDIYRGYMDKMKAEKNESIAPKQGTPLPGGAPVPTPPMATPGGTAPLTGGAPAGAPPSQVV